MHLITVSETNAELSSRDTIGGAPFMPEGESAPQCRICNAQMGLFYQLDIRAEFELPFQPGSHLLVFMCPTHNEIPSLRAIYDDSPLPDAFWDADDGHFALRLYRPGALRNGGRLDEYISSHILRFERAKEEIQDFGDFDVGSYEFKIGGVPGWMNYCLDKNCPCGGKMSFVCQTPDGFGFKKTPTAPEQPNSFSSVEYCLFLGNHVNILACDRQCDPRAVIATCDN
jgi:hypothetical protein